MMDTSISDEQVKKVKMVAKTMKLNPHLFICVTYVTHVTRDGGLQLCGCSHHLSLSFLTPTISMDAPAGFISESRMNLWWHSD